VRHKTLAQVVRRHVPRLFLVPAEMSSDRPSPSVVHMRVALGPTLSRTTQTVPMGAPTLHAPSANR